MGTLYFARHGEPAFPDRKRVCLGRLDLPISTLGRLQAATLAHDMGEIPLSAIFSSPLLRAGQTADFLHRRYQVMDALQEIDTGDWDGFAFEEIRRKWPELYKARGEDRLISFPHAEPLGISLLRFIHAVGNIAMEASGNILFVTHAGILCAFLSVLKNLPPLKDLPSLAREDVERLLSSSFSPEKLRKPRYGSISALAVENGRFVLQEWGRLPHPIPNRAFCLELLKAAGVPSHIQCHCEAVARKALELVDALETAGHFLCRESVLASSLLHDMARREKHHAEKGASFLEHLGYPELAEPVRTHHDIPPDTPLNESAILFLADKLVQEDRPVSLEERFGKSLAKCSTEDARRKHKERFRTACRIAGIVNEFCGQEIAKIHND